MARRRAGEEWDRHGAGAELACRAGPPGSRAPRRRKSPRPGGRGRGRDCPCLPHLRLGRGGRQGGGVTSSPPAGAAGAELLAASQRQGPPRPRRPFRTP